jgi:predicted transposase YdaD
MTYITTGERIGYERGIQEGRQEGIQGRRSLVIRQLQRRVGQLPQSAQTTVENLSLNQLDNLGEALLDFSTLDDLNNWLENNQ